MECDGSLVHLCLHLFTCSYLKQHEIVLRCSENKRSELWWALYRASCRYSKRLKQWILQAALLHLDWKPQQLWHCEHVWEISFQGDLNFFQLFKRKGNCDVIQLPRSSSSQEVCKFECHSTGDTISNDPIGIHSKLPQSSGFVAWICQFIVIHTSPESRTTGIHGNTRFCVFPGVIPLHKPSINVWRET